MQELADIRTLDRDFTPDLGAVPKHVAIIMDGNGRWARERGLPRTVGHRFGVEAVRRTIRAAIAMEIKHLTLFSFSSENWSRPAAEVDDLLGLMKRFIVRDLADLHAAGVRIRLIGERIGVDPALLAIVDDAVEFTRQNNVLTLILAFNYGGRAEIVRAVRDVAHQCASGLLDPDDITSEMLSQAMDTQDLPDPDLLIRTSGEMRLSNFLLWQVAYTEFVFIDAYWPDFGHDLLHQAISVFQGRDRRYGGLSLQAER